MNGRRGFGSWFNQILQSWTFSLDQVRLPYAKRGDLSRRLCLRRMSTIRPGNSECVGGNVADFLNSKREGLLNSGGSDEPT
jgi:hypothetical protein